MPQKRHRRLFRARSAAPVRPALLLRRGVAPQTQAPDPGGFGLRLRLGLGSIGSVGLGLASDVFSSAPRPPPPRLGAVEVEDARPAVGAAVLVELVEVARLVGVEPAVEVAGLDPALAVVDVANRLVRRADDARQKPPPLVKRRRIVRRRRGRSRSARPPRGLRQHLRRRLFRRRVLVLVLVLFFFVGGVAPGARLEEVVRALEPADVAHDDASVGADDETLEGLEPAPRPGARAGEEIAHHAALEARAEPEDVERSVVRRRARDGVVVARAAVPPDRARRLDEALGAHLVDAPAARQERLEGGVPSGHRGGARGGRAPPGVTSVVARRDRRRVTSRGDQCTARARADRGETAALNRPAAPRRLGVRPPRALRRTIHLAARSLVVLRARGRCRRPSRRPPRGRAPSSAVAPPPRALFAPPLARASHARRVRAASRPRLGR